MLHVHVHQNNMNKLKWKTKIELWPWNHFVVFYKYAAEKKHREDELNKRNYLKHQFSCLAAFGVFPLASKTQNSSKDIKIGLGFP